MLPFSISTSTNMWWLRSTTSPRRSQLITSSTSRKYALRPRCRAIATNRRVNDRQLPLRDSKVSMAVFVPVSS